MKSRTEVSFCLMESWRLCQSLRYQFFENPSYGSGLRAAQIAAEAAGAARFRSRCLRTVFWSMPVCRAVTLTDRPYRFNSCNTNTASQLKYRSLIIRLGSPSVKKSDGILDCFRSGGMPSGTNSRPADWGIFASALLGSFHPVVTPSSMNCTRQRLYRQLRRVGRGRDRRSASTASAPINHQQEG